MREYHARNGPFPTQPFYKDDEIELISEDALASEKLLPTKPEPIRIDRFIEKRFKIIPTTKDLPAGILGYTTFSTSGVKEIVIASAIDNDDDATTRRRARTTFAHEATHGLLHAHLFATTSTQAALPGQETATPQVMCRDDAPRHGYDGRWWEVQANKGMAALLLPRRLVRDALTDFLAPDGSLGLFTINDRTGASKHISATFDVNPIVARYRLDALFPASTQASL